jgi:hypothetical protein
MQVAILDAQMEVLEDVIVESAERAEEAAARQPKVEGGRVGAARRVSLHSVGCAGMMNGLFDKWCNDIFDGKRRWRNEVKVCIHACGLSGEAWTQIEKVSRHSQITAYILARTVRAYWTGMLLSPPRTAEAPEHLSVGLPCRTSRVIPFLPDRRNALAPASLHLGLLSRSDPARVGLASPADVRARDVEGRRRIGERSRVEDRGELAERAGPSSRGQGEGSRRDLGG